MKLFDDILVMCGIVLLIALGVLAAVCFVEAMNPFRKFTCYQHEGNPCRIIVLKDGTVMLHEERQ